SDTDTLRILQSDQNSINRYSVINSQVLRLKAQRKALKQRLVDLEDAISELELMDGQCNLKVGDAFILDDAEKIVERLNKEKEQIEAELEEKNHDFEEGSTEMAKLKKILYAKFGNQIQLERGDEDDEDS
ncbi:hypothetical protein ROZALSC1DRAFT_27180, partial [Rozella allomycis CSF55]